MWVGPQATIRIECEDEDVELCKEDLATQIANEVIIPEMKNILTIMNKERDKQEEQR